jgi:hypothetical protein
MSVNFWIPSHICPLLLLSLPDASFSCCYLFCQMHVSCLEWDCLFGILGYFWGRGSVVGVVFCYRLDCSRFQLLRGWDFVYQSRSALLPPSLLYGGYQVFLLRGIAAGMCILHTHIKYWGQIWESCTSTPLFLPPMACHRVTITPTFVICTGCSVSLYISAWLYCVSNVHFIAF